MNRAGAAVLALALAAALAGCTPVRDNGDGTVTVPWWVFWQSQQTTRTETRYVPAPAGPQRQPAYRAPAPQFRAPAPAPRPQVRLK